MDDPTFRRLTAADLRRLSPAIGPDEAPPSPAPSATLPISSGEPIAMYPGPIPLGAVQACPRCGEAQERRRTAPNQGGRTLDYWTDCACWRQRVADAAAVSQRGVGRQRGTRGIENELGAAYDIRTLAQQMTREPFDVDLCPAWPQLIGWLRGIHAQAVVTGYRAGAPAALFLVGPRGRGKTRTAIELALEADRLDRRVALVNEQKYLTQLRGVPFGPAYEALMAEPGERAWLTVVDDIGKHRITSDTDRAHVQNAWYGLLDRRYNRRGWTILTSEQTLDQLVAAGTIDDSLYSRLYEMTRGATVPYTGADLRLRG